MGYAPEHRERTRLRIVQSAARQFRKRGYETASIDEIMAGAGLTRGGFYLHFRSKQDLFAAVLSEDLEFTRELRNAQEEGGQDSGLCAKRAIAYYLAPANQAKIARGCTVVSNAADIARSRKPARAAFTESFRDLAAEFKGLAHPANSDEQAGLAALATCIGGVVLARALTDAQLVEDLLGACERAAGRILAGPRT